jgi:isopenicillin-N epimerase
MRCAILSSSVVERSTVNRLVAGSNPAWGVFKVMKDSTHWLRLWSLDPGVTFLNHGSFGACPIAIQQKQQALRAQMESEPVRFFALELEPLLDEARQALAQFVGADAERLAFVPNATAGVNTVLRSLSFQPGDELLTTNHEYNASRNALNFAAQQSGASVVIAEVPFPIAEAEQAIEAVLSAVTANTKLVLLDHVTSQTGLIFPLQPLIRALTERGIEVLVDGAHAPGMMPLNLRELGATYYTGNCHKWLCSPKGAAFLYMAEGKALRPLAISHGANSPRTDRSLFRLEFDWTGTADPTAYLCVPDAIHYLGSLLPGGWTELMKANREKAIAARNFLCQVLNTTPPYPDDMTGAMATIPLPRGSAENLQMALFQRFQIEVPIIPWQGSGDRLIRISAQLYNTQTDYDVLARALMTVVSEEQLDPCENLG